MNKKKQNQKSAEQPDLLDVLLDPDNRDFIVLENEDGNQISFEQVANIPLSVNGKKHLYVILKPRGQFYDIADDEAIAFNVNSDKNGNTYLRVEDDEEITCEVFERYYILLEKSIIEKQTKLNEKKEKPND